MKWPYEIFFIGDDSFHSQSLEMQHRISSCSVDE